MLNGGYEESVRSKNDEILKSQVSTQTDISPCTIRSWQIQRIKEGGGSSLNNSGGSGDYIPLLPDGSEVFVLETRSVGFNASTQTYDDDIYRQSRYETLEILTSWRVFTILIPSFFTFLIYFLNQSLDIFVCSELCKEQGHYLCAFAVLFVVGPSLVLSIYAYEQLIQPDVATIKPMTKKLGRLLCCLQLTPYYLIGRRLVWSIKAWSWSYHRDERFRSVSRELWDKAALEGHSTLIKMFQSLLESVPQLNLQSYTILREICVHREDGTEIGPSALLWLSLFVSLISASSGLALVQSENMYERIAGSVTIFTTLGSRVIISTGIGTISPGLWIAPFLASFLIGFVTKVSESSEKTLVGHLQKLPKLATESIMMATAFPPFDHSGIFCSFVYFLTAIIFLFENPSNPLNIVCVILATVGQTIWLSVGFCLLKRPNDGSKRSETTANNGAV